MPGQFHLNLRTTKSYMQKYLPKPNPTDPNGPPVINFDFSAVALDVVLILLEIRDIAIALAFKSGAEKAHNGIIIP